MADEAARLETKVQEQTQRDTVATRVAQLVAMADAARSSNSELDLAAIQQVLGSEAMLDAAVGMMQGMVQGAIDNQAAQTALTTALTQQKLIEDAKTQGIITEAQATQMTGMVNEELKAAVPVKTEKVEEPKAEAPAVSEQGDQVAAKREELKAAIRPDQIAAKRAEQAEAPAKGRGAA